MDVLPRIEKGRYRPSKNLMDHVAAIIKGLPTQGHSEYVLLDEQLVVFEKVVSLAKEGFHSRKKVAVIVQGGPGTGKSVIALSQMGELLAKGYNAHYATNSKSFVQTLRKVLGERGRVLVNYLSSYNRAELNSVDVLIADEAHRLKARTQIPHQKTRDVPQVDEILKAAKVSVFFVDDRQNVKPDEVGTAAHIREHAESAGCTVHQFKLDVQFRCKGSEGFVNWVENTLGIADTANVLWNSDDKFDFRVFDSPESLQDAIEARVAEGNRGRLVAGFCWPWSKLKDDGTLVDDVVIGEFHRPWNARAARGLADDIPVSSLWAYDPNGMQQVGCVYTIQGFDFDYVGVIFGNDIVYDFETRSWVGHPENSRDPAIRNSQDQFVALVKNIYRILLSRAMKGCYVFFLDKNTERFVKSRMERTSAPISLTETAVSRLVLLPPSDPRARIDAYRTLVPVYSLRAAAGYFGRGEPAELQGWTEVNGVGKLDEQMFVAQVVGHSMEPRISDGEYCLFKANPVGTRQEKIVLAQCREIHDPDTGGSFTVKKYSSEKVALGEDEWRHTRIVLTPINPQYKPIVLKPEDDVQIVAELLTVLGRE